jgi:hypothetical protein
MKRPLRSRILALLAALAMAPVAREAHADPPPKAEPRVTSVVLLPTAIADPKGIRPARERDKELLTLAQGLDALLSDTTQDLGLAVVPPSAPAGRLRDRDLLDRARIANAPVLLPSLRALESGDIELRMALAAPGAHAVDALREPVSRANLPVRAVVLLRDLLKRRSKPKPPPPAVKPVTPASVLAKPGRVSLIANATVFGGLIGVSIQRGSGSGDPRVLFPLLAVGAGVGLGASLLASGEWDVSTGDAWYFAAGAWWPSAAAHLVFQGRFADHRPDSERWIFGLLGGTAGVTLASMGLAVRPVTDGDALMAHSGGALGLAFGALVEMAARGDTKTTPFAGMGYGAGLGWLAAAAVAVHVDVTPLRVLTVDLGAALGGVAGAALGSPLLVNDPSVDKQRAWATITASSAVVGGVITAIVARPRKTAKAASLRGSPLIGVLGESRVGALSAPILGAGWSGVWE